MNSKQAKKIKNAKLPLRVSVDKQLNYLVALQVLVIPVYILVVGISSITDSYHGLYGALHNPSPILSVFQNWGIFAVAIASAAVMTFNQQHNNQIITSKIKSISSKLNIALLIPSSIVAISCVIQIQWQQRINHAIEIEEILDQLSNNPMYYNWQHRYRFEVKDKGQYENLLNEIKKAYNEKLSNNHK